MVENETSYKIGDLAGDMSETDLIKYVQMRFKNALIESF